MNDGRRPLVAGNWKMNGLRADGLALADGVAAGVAALPGAVEVVLCPPATLLLAVGERLAAAGGGVGLGGQDCAVAEKGAHTGDVSAAMLRDAGCGWVIVGHSERRADHGETSAQVRDKARAAAAAGLVPIVCVGETEAERDAGRTLAVIGAQAADSMPETVPGAAVVAYEPVWAIGTGRVPTADDIAAAHAHIRQVLGERGVAGERLRVLYGGSVKPANAAAIAGIAGVDGALVGGASLAADDFLAICQSWAESV